jgi:Family of unknown function (DUF6807)
MTITTRILARTGVLRYAIVGLTLASASFAQVKFTRDTDIIHINVDGKPFADYHYGKDVAKPFLAPLHAASGTLVTRQWPMVQGLGETTDHLHHRGMWFGYISVNGYNFWENEFSYKNPKAGTIVVKSIDEVKGGKKGTLKATSEWMAPDGKNLLEDTQTMVFSGDKNLRQVDVDIVLTAKEKCVFGDDKDGIYGIRLADPLTEKNSGTMVNSDGLKTMKNIWGKHANWVDYSGEIKGEKLGIAMFDHPTSFRHPSRWHSRDYGLFAVNPFGSQTFDKANEKSEVVLNPGEKLHFRYLVVIHGELSLEKVGEMYNAWAAKK